MLDKIIYKNLFSKAFDITIEVTYWDGQIERYGTGMPAVKVRLNKEIPIKLLTNQPTLVLGEAYMNGDIEVDGSIQELIASAYRQKTVF